MKNAEIERRREVRIPTTGRVEIVIDNGVHDTIEAELIDISASGFRAGHHHTRLELGDRVSFTHAKAQGEAKVMWNRVAGGSVQTGFLVLS